MVSMTKLERKKRIPAHAYNKRVCGSLDLPKFGLC
jgi:hypothetical protein